MTRKNAAKSEALYTVKDWPRGAGRPAERAIARLGVTRLEQLARRTEAELLALHGVGPKAIRVLREALESRGLSFARGSVR